MNIPSPSYTRSVSTMSRTFVPLIPNHMNSFEHTGNSVTTNALYCGQQIQNGTFNNQSTPYDLCMSNVVAPRSIRNLNPDAVEWHIIDAEIARIHDNQQYSPQARNSNSISDVNNLMALCSAEYARIQNSGGPIDAASKFIFSVSKPVPNTNNRNLGLFDERRDDINAVKYICNCQQCDLPIETFEDLSKWFDQHHADEQFMDVQTIGYPETASEPSMNNSNQYVYDGLQYQLIPPSQPISSPKCQLGRTEVTYLKPDFQVQLPIDFDFDILKNEKPSKNSKTNASSSPPPPPPPTPNRIYPFIYENGKKRRMLLHEFLRRLLDNANFSHIAQYVDKRRGIFKIIQKEEAAKLWETTKGRNSDRRMTYQNLARGIRYYYKLDIIQRTRGRFTFRFGAASGFGTTWLPV